MYIQIHVYAGGGSDRDPDRDSAEAPKVNAQQEAAKHIKSVKHNKISPKRETPYTLLPCQGSQAGP
jgi:hypothetical protein